LAKGFKDDKKKFHPTKKNNSQLSSLELKSRNKNQNPDIERADTLKKQKSTIGYDEANKNFEDFLSKTKLKVFTFDPEVNRAFDFRNKNDVKQFHKMFVVPKDSNNTVYAISLTNNLNLTNSRLLQSNYDLVRGRGLRPMFGFFVGERGDNFVDITEIISDISEDKAIRLGKKYKQESISAIFKNGDFDLIFTDE